MLFDVGIMAVTLDLSEYHMFCGGMDGSIFQVDLCAWVSAQSSAAPRCDVAGREGLASCASQPCPGAALTLLPSVFPSNPSRPPPFLRSCSRCRGTGPSRQSGRTGRSSKGTGEIPDIPAECFTAPVCPAPGLPADLGSS